MQVFFICDRLPEWIHIHHLIKKWRGWEKEKKVENFILKNLKNKNNKILKYFFDVISIDFHN